jgi:hypothetical protein
MNDKELDQIIEKSFSIETDFHLPIDFAQKVANTIVRREQWKTDLNEYLSITGIIIFLLTIVSGTYYLVNKEYLLKAYALVSENIVPVILVVFLINFILFTDRVLLRLLFSRWNRT